MFKEQEEKIKEKGHQKVDLPNSSRKNASRRGAHNVPVTIDRATQCPKCGHKKAFRKQGKRRCCSCKVFY